MKKVFQLAIGLAVMVTLSSCASALRERDALAVSAVVVNADSLVLVGFSNLGYYEQRVLIKVTAPEEMKDEVLAISFKVAWGKKATSYGDVASWQKPVGTPVRFTVGHKDITSDGLTTNRRIHADKLRGVEWPIKPPQTTTGSSAPSRV